MRIISALPEFLIAGYVFEVLWRPKCGAFMRDGLAGGNNRQLFDTLSETSRSIFLSMFLCARLNETPGQ